MPLNLGYSFWGFLGSGITDTPDGGRSHRLAFLEGLTNAGYRITLLQKNRDLLEANEKIALEGIQYHSGFPKLDILFMEHRWEIPGRNCGISNLDPNYTPDLDRQEELMRFYQKEGIPIAIWDKDQKLTSLPNLYKSVVFEAALLPRDGRKSLFFPISTKWFELANTHLKNYQIEKRTSSLVYIGNQYERDESLKVWIDQPAKELGIQADIFGNWTKYPHLYASNIASFPNCTFKGRLAFSKLCDAYQSCQFTVLIAPERYYKTGQFTQRLFEALCNLCIPLVPRCYHGIEQLIIPEFIVNDPLDVPSRMHFLRSLHLNKLRSLLKLQISRLEFFSVANQVRRFSEAIKNL